MLKVFIDGKHFQDQMRQCKVKEDQVFHLKLVKIAHDRLGQWDVYFESLAAKKLGWQKEWPGKTGAWWFYGVMKREKQPALFVVVVHATKNEPPVYIAAWQQEIMQPGEITGWFKWIPTPEMPDGSKVDVW